MRERRIRQVGELYEREKKIEKKRETNRIIREKVLS